mgnify:CR=1 FL=1
MFKVFTIIAIISYNILINLLKKRISDMSLLTVTGLTHGFGDERYLTMCLSSLTGLIRLD